jgi:hypothetical protein
LAHLIPLIYIIYIAEAREATMLHHYLIIAQLIIVPVCVYTLLDTEDVDVKRCEDVIFSCLNKCCGNKDYTRRLLRAWRIDLPICHHLRFILVMHLLSCCMHAMQ